MSRGVLLYNPAAGRRRGRDLVPTLIRILRSHGWTITELPTAGPGSASNQLREATRRDPLDAVFAYGGDGTLREAAQGLRGSPTALGALPGGTTNVVCQSLGIPLDPITAVDALVAGRRREISLGRIGEQVFLMQVSAGIDAAVVAAATGESKARWGKAAILARGAGLLWKHPFVPIEARWNDRREAGGFVAVANLPHYAGPFELARVAAEKPELELVIHRPLGAWPALRFTIDLLRGRHGERDDVLRVPVTEVELSAPAGTCLQIDGDVCGAELPATVRVAEERLRVLVPR